MVIRKCVPNALGESDRQNGLLHFDKGASKLDKLTTLLITEYVTMMVEKLRYG